MLYIPAEWGHEVLTLEDNSLNLNYTFFRLDRESTPRHARLMRAHRALRSHLCQDLPSCGLTRASGPEALAQVLWEVVPLMFVPPFVLLVLLHQKGHPKAARGVAITVLLVCVYLSASLSWNEYSMGTVRLAFSPLVVLWSIVLAVGCI